MDAPTQRITTCLWFDGDADAAVSRYLGIFPNASRGATTHYDAETARVSGQREGDVLTIDFELDGQRLLALNGGRRHPFNESVSLMVQCDSQEEIDHYWAALGEGGDASARQCGWLRDRFGLSWQIVPRETTAWLSDPATAARVMRALMPMQKLDLAALRAAAAG